MSLLSFEERMTNLDHEKKTQEKWQLLPQYQYLATRINKMIDNEFLPPEQQLEVQSASLRNLIHYVTRRVPFYSHQFRELGLRADEIEQHRIMEDKIPP